MIIHADALNMPLQDCSVDAIVTDPPYGLEFMGKEWDRLLAKDRHVDYASCRNAHGPNEYKAGLEAQLWHTQWLTEAYRVLKPGGSMLVMGGTRTFHRLMCAIEDAGFIIKDTLMWIYGSGFPKAQDLGKMIDKRARRQYVNVAIELGLYIPGNSKWDWTKGEHGISDKWWEKFKSFLSPKDWQKIERNIINKQNKARAEGQKSALPAMGAKTEYINIDITAPSTDLAKYWDGFKIGGIKPAYEPIVWAVKPPEGSYVDNVLKWGVGAVNVDECRIPSNGDIGNTSPSHSTPQEGWDRPWRHDKEQSERIYQAKLEGNEKAKQLGRFPANIILDEESAKVMNEQSGNLVSKWGKQSARHNGNKSMFNLAVPNDVNKYTGDSGGASRFFYCAKASRSERNAGLEGMEEKPNISENYGTKKVNLTRKDMGENRVLPTKNVHPTVKPIALFEWLIKLVTREGQTVLDPFLGSGTTAISAHNTGRKCIGIEKEGEYIEIAKRRTAYHESQPRQMEMRV